MHAAVAQDLRANAVGAQVHAAALGCLGRAGGTFKLGQQLRGAFAAVEQHGHALALRTYGVGAQILRECGVQKMQLMGQPRRMPSMAGYGLEITGYIPKE